MEKLEIVKLLDLYENVLTEKQKEIASLYFYEDLSLSEIAEEKGISRNAVHLTIIRVTNHLKELESELKIKEKYDKISDILEKDISKEELKEKIKKILI